MRQPLLLLFLLAACAAPDPTPTPSPASEPDPFYLATAGGEPRSAGYWLLWNSCAPDNRADQAAANGGRETGWLLMDDLLADPGVLLGPLAVETCPAGVRLLRGEPLDGDARPADAAYPLAAQLLAAQLNLAAGALSCPAVEDLVTAGQLLLLEVGFDGHGDGLPPGGDTLRRDQAAFITAELSRYSGGRLCRQP